MLEQLKRDLIRDEDLRQKPYRCTSGKLTIGVGRNLDDVGLSNDEALLLLDNDVRACMADLDRSLSWWRQLSDGRQRALLNMCFNLGWPRLSGFKKMLAALERGDFENASREALNSRWARQVGQRANRIADLLREG